MDVVIFPGKDTPIKRYQSYFPQFKLRLVKDGEKPNVVLAHSLGFFHAIEYSLQYFLDTLIIINIDGVHVDNIPSNCYVYSFIPFKKISGTIVSKFQEIYQYDLPDDLSHYPYQNKKIRDDIVKLVNKLIK